MRRLRAFRQPIEVPRAFTEVADIPRTPEERDAAMVALASNAFAIVDVPDLRSLGIDSAAVSRRLRRGRLYRLHQGVYSVIPPELLKPNGRWLAAVKAIGPGAGLAWPHAGAHWSLRSGPGGPVHVAVSGNGGRRKRPGIVVHRCPSLEPQDIVLHEGIPVTTPRRTLEDAQRSVSADHFESLLRKAEKQQLDTGKFGEIEHIDLNKFERRFFALCRRHSVPVPQTQQIVGPYTVDFLWEEARLIVETDGFEDHGTRTGFEADRARDAWLMMHGYRVVRFTWRQLRDDPATVIATLRNLLGIAR